MSEPKPRAKEFSLTPFRFDVGDAKALPIPKVLETRSAIEVLETRSTARAFGQLNDEMLGALLWIAARTKDARILPSGYSWQHRAAPSAGGRHPIELIILAPHLDAMRPYLYNPVSHSVSLLTSATPGSSERLIRLVQDIVPRDGATIVWLVAEPERTDAKYEYGHSLVWRDAGALLATLSFAAEALGLAFCCLGATGENWVRECFDSERLLGVGGCLVGSRSL